MSAQNLAGDRDSGWSLSISPITSPGMTTPSSNALDTADQAEDQSSVQWGRGEQIHLFAVMPINYLTWLLASKSSYPVERIGE